MEEKSFPEIMTMEEICGYINVHRSIVLGFIEDGMPFIPLRNNPTSHKRFKKADIDIWLSERGQHGEEP